MAMSPFNASPERKARRLLALAAVIANLGLAGCESATSTIARGGLPDERGLFIGRQLVEQL